jgi:hypothetical protein
MRKLCGRISRYSIGFCAAVMLLTAWQRPVGAVIVLGGHDADGTPDSALGRNLNSAPSNLSSYIGTWGLYLGTPIAPRYFITANHIGDGGSGGTFAYGDGTLSINTYTATLAGTSNDLAIWKISNSDRAFTHYAPLYTTSTEVGNALVSVGRGTPRGTSVTSPQTSQQAGWNWGSADTAISWGANTVAAAGPISNPPAGFGGDFLTWTFNNNSNLDTGILSDGDSGGPTFVFNPAHSQYELAGINSLVDQVSSQQDSATNPQFLMRAALYDARGFWDGPNQIGGSNPVPLSSYSTRISSEISFIDSVTGLPEPSSVGLLVAVMAALLRRRRRN